MSTEAKKNRLSGLLRDYQERAGISARALARQMRLNPSSLGNYLDGTSYPTTDTREKIARAIGMTPNELESYLDSVPLQPLAPLEQTIQDIKAMTHEDFRAVVDAVFARIQDDLRQLSVPSER